MSPFVAQAVQKLDLIWLQCCAEHEFQRFFALRVTPALKIQGAYVPRRLFTQPGPIADARFAGPSVRNWIKFRHQ
jgi:hypothetical protein